MNKHYRPERVLRPLNLVTYNVQGLPKPNMYDGPPNPIEEVLFSMYDSRQLVPTRHGWAPSLRTLDVICLQEAIFCKDDSQGQLDWLLTFMEERGYAFVRAGQLIILWNTGTMERVCEGASSSGGDSGDESGGNSSGGDSSGGDSGYSSGGDGGYRSGGDSGGDSDGSSGSDNSGSSSSMPDFEWNLEGKLGSAWKEAADHNETGQPTFFRYPPITVVLRRRETNTIYVVTTVHVPGSEDDVTQLRMEIEWLMNVSRYAAVLRYMVRHVRGLDAVLGRSGGLKPSETEDDVVHIMAGDFNTHLFPKMNGCTNGPGSHEEVQDLLDKWVAVYGRHQPCATPSSKNESQARFPDVVYVLKKFMKGRVAVSGVITLPMALTLEREHTRYLFSGSVHKPLVVSLIEKRQESDVRSAATPLPHDDAVEAAALLVQLERRVLRDLQRGSAAGREAVRVLQQAVKRVGAVPQ